MKLIPLKLKYLTPKHSKRTKRPIDGGKGTKHSKRKPACWGKIGYKVKY
ncbi:MAG: hypothetical protein AABY07_07950 [Nanoarchaeota archaeon]